MNSFDNIPVVRPIWDDIPWAIAFTTVAYSDDKTYNFKAGESDEARAVLKEQLGVDTMVWLTLNHGNNVITVPHHDGSGFADAVIVGEEGYAAAITTADCLPVIVASPSSRQIAAIHAGWKGIANGVIENTLKIMSEDEFFHPEQVKAWIGPAVKDDYEIMQDARNVLLDSPNVFESNFVPTSPEHFLADLSTMVKQKLSGFGITDSQVEVFPESTLSSNRFFSARKEGIETGRMGTVVGII